MSDSIHAAQVSTLYSSLSIFYAAALATLICAAVIWWRHPTPLFTLWLLLEVTTIAARIVLLNRDRRAARAGRATGTDLYLAMTLIWAATLGYGAAITTLSGDFAAAIVVNITSACIAGGMSIRYFGAPRFVLLACTAALGPMAMGAAFAGDWVLIVTTLQAPLALFSMSQAAKRLNRMMIATMEAEHENAHRAAHDELTGLLNRAGFMRAAAARAGIGGTLFYIDLDGFKPVNDRHGHEAGDAVLREVAARLAGIAGRHSQAARMGGDEFVLLTPMLSAGATERLGARIVEVIAGHGYALGSAEARIGVSVGAAAMTANDAIDDALRRADAALYGAKTRGGGTVRLAA
ncbi:GGDEF domain-containing protein [Sphingomonas sp. LT1P40]|uniref:GGDEF domain-containing protein n=1 Tax=Alteristakelama amylovorans TaxID=3096166 RepID=UPI002FC7D7B7